MQGFDISQLEDQKRNFKPTSRKIKKTAAISKEFETACTEFAEEILPLWGKYTPFADKDISEGFLTPASVVDLLRKHSIPVIPINQHREKYRLPESMILNVKNRPVVFVKNGHFDVSATTYILAYSLSQILEGAWIYEIAVNKHLPFIYGQFQHGNYKISDADRQHHEFAIRLLMGNQDYDLSSFSNTDTPASLAIKALEFGVIHNVDAGTVLHCVANEYLMSDLCSPALTSLSDKRTNDLLEKLFLGYTNFGTAGISDSVKEFMKY